MTPSTASLPRTSSRADERVALAACATLQQCAAFVETLTDAVYTTPSVRIAGSTIGQHVRHALDHFAAAAGALDGQAIDYDHRDRDTPVERDRQEALRQIRAIQSTLGSVGADATMAVVRVRVMISGAGDEATLDSTFGRELAFASHHAIHHHAMIASIAREHGVEPPQGFGKAPSTLHHEESRTDAR